MRDRRFIAEHRGGLLPRDSHICLARWAADCAESVIEYFEIQSNDSRPREAVAIGRRWANGEVKTGVAMKASLAAHAAARSVTDVAAIAAARASAQAVATAHASDHSMGALLYALKVWEAAGKDPGAEFDQQIERLPAHLRDQVASGVMGRAKRLITPTNAKATLNARSAKTTPPPHANPSTEFHFPPFHSVDLQQ